MLSLVGERLLLGPARFAATSSCKSFSRVFSCSSVVPARGVRTPGYREERVATNSDGSVIVCWHPEPKFPYELTRPVPRGKGQIQTDSKLQVKFVEDMKELYHHKHDRFKVRDLMRLTWTSKYKWIRPQLKHKRYYDFSKRYPRERPYM